MTTPVICIIHRFSLLGDLAEVAVYQGPRLQGDLYIGPHGKWNDTAIPRVRYMNQSKVGGGDLWQMTYAEGRGGIDGTHHRRRERGITYCWPLTCAARTSFFFFFFFFKIFIAQTVYRVSQEERAKLREGVPYVKLYRYNPKHLCPKLNGY